MSNEDLEGADIWGASDGAGGAGGAGGPGGDKPGGDRQPQPGAQAQQSEDDDEEEGILNDETMAMSTTELRQRIRLLDNDIRVMRSDVQRIAHESRGQRDRIRENVEKVKLNKQLPYLVGNIVEVLEPDAEDGALLRSLS